MRNYYAGYNDMYTEVLVFETRKERDAWVAGDCDFPVDLGFERIAITAKEAKILAGKHFKNEPEWDEFQNFKFYENWSAA